MWGNDIPDPPHPSNLAASISRPRKPRKSADAHGLPRKLMGAIVLLPRSNFIHLWHFPIFFLIISPLPYPARENRGRPRNLAAETREGRPNYPPPACVSLRGHPGTSAMCVGGRWKIRYYCSCHLQPAKNRIRERLKFALLASNE